MDSGARPGTVTCGDGRQGTCCLLFAIRGSGVRVPLALQVRSQIRTAGPRVRQQSTATGSCETPHTRSSWVSVFAGGNGLKCPKSRSWTGLRAAEQEARVRHSSAQTVGPPVGSVLNLPLQGLLLPLMQRVNEWKLFPPLAVRFSLMLHKFMARKSPIPCGQSYEARPPWAHADHSGLCCLGVSGPARCAAGSEQLRAG